MGLYARMLREIDSILQEDCPDGEKVRRIEEELSIIEIPHDRDEIMVDLFMDTQENHRHARPLLLTELPFGVKDDEIE